MPPDPFNDRAQSDLSAQRWHDERAEAKAPAERSLDRVAKLGGGRRDAHVRAEGADWLLAGGPALLRDRRHERGHQTMEPLQQPLLGRGVLLSQAQLFARVLECGLRCSLRVAPLCIISLHHGSRNRFSSARALLHRRRHRRLESLQFGFRRRHSRRLRTRSSLLRRRYVAALERILERRLCLVDELHLALQLVLRRLPRSPLLVDAVGHVGLPPRVLCARRVIARQARRERLLSLGCRRTQRSHLRF
mmetsp:Transcript_15666/g.30595  ORF Transcript_15666/g.30595 Transcript_15666/m.30595 type:complete len:248 (-) Transcript_15666:520-1263(-)